MKHIKLAKSEQRTDLTPYSFNNVVAALASSAKRIHNCTAGSVRIVWFHLKIVKSRCRRDGITTFLQCCCCFLLFQCSWSWSSKCTQKKHKTIALNFIARYNHDYKTLNAFASWIKREFVLVCNEMHIFSLSKQSPFWETLHKTRNYTLWKRWITKWNAIRIKMFCVASNVENIGTELNCNVDALQCQPTHTIFRCCWNNNNNGRKRMKMDWNKITKNVNNKRNETNDVNEASKWTTERTIFRFCCSLKECCMHISTLLCVLPRIKPLLQAITIFLE